MPKLSIIILSYNTADLTYYCLQSVIQNYEKELENGKIEVLILDNGSSDFSVERLKPLISSQKNIQFFKSEENLGFAKGNNKAVSKTTGEYILFLNSDTQLLDTSFLKMTQFLDTHAEIGILGARMKNSNHSIQPSAGKFYDLHTIFSLLFVKERGIRFSPETISKVDWVSGGCMMVKRVLFEKLKGFDEHFFMYIEDMDLCFRAKKQGFLVYFYPETSVLHIGEGSSNRSFAILHIYKGILYFYKKHKSSVEYYIVVVLLKIKALIAILLGTLMGKTHLVNTYKKALRISL